VDEPRTFHLERFYFGNLLLPGNRPSANPGIVARTPGITPELAAEWLRLAALLPPLRSEATAEMPGSLGLFRGAGDSFALVKAQRNDAGLPQLLFVLTPRQALDALGGNVLAFRSLALMEMPSFSAMRTDLQPFVLHCPPLPDEDARTAAINALLSACGDSFAAVEGLLAALIERWPVAIVNSPASAEQRLNFLWGLLSLLPAPARTEITFALHASDPMVTRGDIKFLSQRTTPPQHVVFDWKNAALLTPAVAHPYSHYIVSQLRLDPGLAVEEIDRLATAVAWHARRSDSLSQTLAWTARRAALDQVVQEGQPADRALVAEILRNDPTLTDELRWVYSRHLLAFALALQETDSTDVIPAICATRPALAEQLARFLSEAIAAGQADMVFRLLERWMLRVPETARGQWRAVLQEAARVRVRTWLSAGAIDEAVSFLEQIPAAPAALGLGAIVPDIVRESLSLACQHARLAHSLFLLAVYGLPAGDFHRLLLEQDFVRQLPPATQTAISYLQPGQCPPVRPRVLDEGARPFGDGFRMPVLARLVECAVYLQRIQLVDTPSLLALMVMAQSPQADRYVNMIHQVVHELSEFTRLRTLAPPGPRVLVQLLLQTGAYYDAVELLEFYQEQFFGPQHLTEFTALAGELFLHLALSPDALTQALTHLEGSRLAPEPRCMIYVSALTSRQWADDQDYAARRLTTMIFNDHHLIDTVGTANVLQLLAYYARHRQTLDALRVGAALVDHLLEAGLEGAKIIARMWPTITWDSETTDAARELLRRYVRGVPLADLPAIVKFLESALGKQVGELLRATWLLRLVMGGSDLLGFAEQIHTAAHLLADIAAVYHAEKERPPLHRLRRELDTLTGNLSDYDRARMADNFLAIGRLVTALYTATASARRRPSDVLLISNDAVPHTGLELLLFLGGYLAQGQLFPLDLQRESMAHLFGSRSAAILLSETTSTRHLLENLLSAFEARELLRIEPEALRAELTSHWQTLSLYHQRQLEPVLPADCHHLAQAIRVMAEDAAERALTDSSLGRQLETGRRQPESALEALRWIHGYFAHKHS